MAERESERGKLVYHQGARKRAPAGPPAVGVPTTPELEQRRRADRRRAHRRIAAVWYAGLLLLALALVGKGAADRELARYAIWAGFLFGVGAVFGGLALRVAWSRLPQASRVLLALALGYVALFGPVMSAYLLVVDASANDDLPLLLFRPLVELLNSLE